MIHPKMISLLLLVIAAAGCSGADHQESGRGAHPQPADESHDDIDDAIANPRDHGITEITLQRTACYGICPVYSVVFASDGSFTYDGQANVEKLGRHTGQINPYRFEQLSRFIVACDYMQFDDLYAVPVTDHPTVYTSIVRNGKRKTVSDYADAGPPFLWAIEQLIDKLLLDARWDSPAANP